jgi:hypothetical protein
VFTLARKDSAQWILESDIKRCFIVPKAAAKPEEQIDRFIALHCCCLFSFVTFCPKNPCQAPRSPNPLPHSNIRLSYELSPTR